MHTSPSVGGVLRLIIPLGTKSTHSSVALHFQNHCGDFCCKVAIGVARRLQGMGHVGLQGSLTPFKITGATRQNTIEEIRKGENNG